MIVQQKTHPVWEFLDFLKQGIKNAIHKCKLCGLEKEGISASRWTAHILGRPIGNSSTAGINSCPGGEDKSKLKEAKQVLNEHQRGTEEKAQEKQKTKNALLDRPRLEREALAASMQVSVQPKSLQVPAAGVPGVQTKLGFSASTGKTILEISEASTSNKKPKTDQTCKENHALADAAIARMFYETGMAFEPLEHISFVNMVDVLANHLDPKKTAYQPPTRYDLADKLLIAEVFGELLRLWERMIGGRCLDPTCWHFKS